MPGGGNGQGPLPSGWRWVRLDDLCVGSPGTRDPGADPETEFRYVDISSVDRAAKRITAAKVLKGAAAPSRARCVIRTNDVIVATTRPNLNAVAKIPPELDDQICSTGFCVLRSAAELDPDYLFAFTRSAQFVDALSGLVAGALYPAVKDHQVRDLRIPLPRSPNNAGSRAF